MKVEDDWSSKTNEKTFVTENALFGCSCVVSSILLSAELKKYRVTGHAARLKYGSTCTSVCMCSSYSFNIGI